MKILVKILVKTCYCSQKLLDHAIQSATDVLKTTSKRVIQKTADQLVFLLVIISPTELWKFEKINNKKIHGSNKWEW